MNLVPQKDKVKIDAWTCKSMLSFIKMKTHKKLPSKDCKSCIVHASVCFLQDPEFLYMQRLLNPELEACTLDPGHSR